MTELIPDETHLLARWVNRLFHPYVIAIPTALLLLSDIDAASALGWVLVMVGILLPPLALTTLWLKRSNRFAYQRQSRAPIYAVFIASVVVCLALMLTLNAPRILVACLIALLIWTPLQALINAYVTKISIHAAVVAGCASALWVTGKLSHPLLIAGAIVAVVITLWARVVTKHHTPTQVILGALIGALPVLLVFPRVL
jgi:membrane-associated phospholipid phosphatase